MATGNLFRQAGNTGALQLVGSTGLNILSEGGFDSSKGQGWAVFLGGARIGSPGQQVIILPQPTDYGTSM
jgi:hypothetical protein